MAGNKLINRVIINKQSNGFLCSCFSTDIYGHKCTSTYEVVLSVIGSSGISGCANTTTIGLYQCNHLQSALQYVVDSPTDAECYIFHIQLEAGVHVIMKPISTSSSVHITSSSSMTEEQTIITCNFNASEADGLHSIYFNQSNSVTISNVIMEGCPLPLRLFQVQEVILQNASFRFVYNIT